MRRRIKDQHILALVKAFLKAGVLTEEGLDRRTITGTPQGGILSPLLANIALSTLDEHFTAKWEALGSMWQRVRRRRAGTPAMRLIRYADDFVVLVAGRREHVEALWDEVSAVLAPMGLRLSASKTRITHVDEGFDFLGWRLQRRVWKGRAGKRALYTYPSKLALRRLMDRIRALTRRHRHRFLADLLRAVNRVLRGWGEYFRHGVSMRSFSYVDHFTWRRIYSWLRKRHPGLNQGTLVVRFLPRWQVRDGQTELFRLETIRIVRYRFRGSRIPSPWPATTGGAGTAPA